MEIVPFEEKYKEQLVMAWEKSVAATHHFVTQEDFEYYKTAVRGIDFGALPVFCLIDNEQVAGFIGVENQSVEMLFLAPEYIGKGWGTKLMRLAIDEHQANRVEVNEQNTLAVNFYQKFGFKTYERTETDTEGKNYPLLKMRIKN